MSKQAIVIVALTAALAWPTRADAVTTNWTNAGGGPFTDAGNWDNGVPADGDDAVFDINTPYTVTFTSNVASDSMQLLDGNVTFSSSNTTPPTYTIDPASSVSNALLIGGNVFDRLVVNHVTLLLDGDVKVTGRSTLSVSNGGALTPLNFGFDMQVGDANDDGTAGFSGTGTTLTAGRLTIGSSDHAGTLSFGNGATGSSDDSLSFSRGSLNLQSGSTFDVNSSLFFGHSEAGFTGATINVRGGLENSTLNLNDFGVIGSDAGNTARLNINNGGIVAASSNSLVVVRTTGEIKVNAGGTFNTFGGVSITGGTMRVDGGVANFNSSFSSITVSNGGTLQLTNGGTVNNHADALSVVDGTVHLFDGTLNVRDVLFFDSAGGVDFDFGTLRFAIGKTFSGPAIQQLDISTLSGGKRLEVNGTATLQDAITVGGGSLLTNDLVADSAFNLLGGTVETGAATLNGPVVVDGGAFDASSMSVSSSFDLLRGTVAMPGNLVLNPGATMLVDGGTLTVGSLQNPKRLDFRSGTINLVGDDFIVGTGERWGGFVQFGSGQTFRAIGNSPEVLSNGTLLLEGGKLEIDTLLIEGLVHMSGLGSEIRGDLIDNRGELAGQGRIATNNGVENKAGGQITLTGGQLWIEQFLFNEPGGLVIGNGTLRVDGIPAITNAGDMAFSGLTNIIGDVNNNATGVIISSGGGPLTFYDDVTNNGKIRTNANGFTVYFGSYSGNGDTGSGTVIMEGDLKPGSSPGTMAFGGDLSFGPAAELEIEIGGLTAGSEFDQLTVANDLLLGGLLDVSLLSPFTLSPGQSFEIIDVVGSSDGTFLGLAEGGLVGQFAGLNLLITYAGGDGNDVVLLAALPGDFDIDGDVDGFDFLTWQRDLGVGDLADWQANFGTIAGSLAASSTAIPEPTALLLCGLGSVCGLVFGRRRLEN